MVPPRVDDAISDFGTDKTPDLDVDESISSEWDSTNSQAYEGDFSSYAPSVQWPQRVAISEGQESPAPSVYSFHESLDGYLVRDHHGRSYNTKNEAYLLPADTEEHERLDLQHTMLRNYFGAFYPAKDMVEERLRPRDGYAPKILDIGTGSGAWAIDMAKQFPHCEVVALDLVPPNLRDANVPDNCRFEIDDCNLSFTHWANTFDLVHVRAVTCGIHDFPQFLYNIAQVLKPGGVFIAGAGMHRFHNENGQPYPDVDEGEPGFSWVQKWFTELHQKYLETCLSVPRSPELSIHAHLSWDQWAGSNPNFENVETLAMTLPVGNWSPAPSREIHYANELGRLNVLRLIYSFFPLMIAGGHTPEELERWKMEATKEIQELRLHSNAQWRWMWCTRTDGEWIPQSTDDTSAIDMVP